jgi:HD-like signal output (HDOD) protein
MLTGRLAQEIAKHEGLPKPSVDDALTAGLLHDCGKLVLLANLAKEYAAVTRRARDERRALHEIESQAFGASHAEVGAYLLGIWGLPGQIVEAVAFHHTPRDIAPTGVCLLSIVHVANGLLAEAPEGDSSARESGFDEGFLDGSGLSGRLEHWRALREQIAKDKA